MRNVKKLTAAVAMAIGTAGAGVSVVQADAVMFPYVISSATVTTILTVVNTDESWLHWRYWAKTGADAENANSTCSELDGRWTSSPYDLVDVSVDGYFGDALGVMHDDPSVRADYSEGGDGTMALLKGYKASGKTVRAFAIVENEDSDYDFRADSDDHNWGGLTAARATIIDFNTGAAWGYDGYDPRYMSHHASEEAVAGAPYSAYDFSEDRERFGEVVSGDGVNVAFRPFNEVTSALFVTPIGNYEVCTKNPDNDSNVLDQVCGKYGRPPQPLENNPYQNTGKLQASVRLSIPSELGGTTGDVMYDRDEGKWSGSIPKLVTCVGRVDVQSLINEGIVPISSANTRGGWTQVQIKRPAATLENYDRFRTDEATVLFLEYNCAKGACDYPIDGKDVGGTINNGYLLRED